MQLEDASLPGRAGGVKRCSAGHGARRDRPRLRADRERHGGDEAAAGTKVERKQFELKTGDKYIAGSEKISIESVAYLRVPANRIEPEDLADVIDGWLKLDKRKNAANPGGVPKEEIKELIAKLREQTGPDGKPLDVGVVMTIAIGFALTVMYSAVDAPDTD